MADEFVVTGNVIHTALEVIGTRLRDGIDIRAGVTFLRYVVVGNVDLYRLNRIDRNGLLGSRCIVGFKAKRVVGGDAVNGERVVTRVLTSGRDLAALFVGLRNTRVEARVILEIALDGRECIKLSTTDAGSSAHRGVAELV